MKGRSMLLAGLLAVVAMLAVLHATRSGPFARGGHVPDAAGKGGPVADAAGGPSPQAVPKVPDRPLPPVDMPLGTVIDDLKRRAERGEAGAACRLAAELTYCQKLQNQMQNNESALRRWERRAASYTPSSGKQGRPGMSVDALERGIDSAQRQVDRSKSQLAHCAGIPAPRVDEITRYWRMAALAGHVPSMRNYAVGNGFRRNEILNNLPALAVYRQEAVRIARQAVDRGDLRTAIALAGAYSPLSVRNQTYLSQLVQPDAGESLALLYRINDAIERGGRFQARENVRSELTGMIAELEAGMSPGEIRQAGARAENSPPLTAGSRELQGLFVVAGGFVADVPREECDLAAWNRQP